jgi:hypothetical protein
VVQPSVTIAAVALSAYAGLEGEGGLPFGWVPALALGTVVLTAVGLRHSLRGAPGAGKRFLDHARAYVPLMRRHIDKEDQCLFPWVERYLTTLERASLQEAFGAAVRPGSPPGAGGQPRQPAGRLTAGS